MNQFEDLLAWQKAKELSLNVYSCFNELNDWGFKRQIQRASISVMNNIAEGFERRSNKEFRQFLFIAKGSCGEIRSMLHLALELNLIDQSRFDELSSLSIETSRILSGLIKSIKV